MRATAPSVMRLATVLSVAFMFCCVSCTAGTAERQPGSSSGPTATDADTPPTPASASASTTGSSDRFGAGCDTMPEFGKDSVEGLSKEDILTAAERSPELATLVSLVKRSRLSDTLSNAGDITVFTPNERAFQRLDSSALRKIVASKSRLTDTLLFHVVPGRLSPDQLPGTHRTLDGRVLTVHGSGEDLTVERDAHVVCGNVQTANGVVYVIDRVLLPK